MERECSGTGGGQAANPHCLPDGERALYPSDTRVRAPHISGFEVEPLEI